MQNRLEELLRTTANDGASTPLTPTRTRTEVEIEELMDAWFLERHQSIEFEILLRESRGIIVRLLSQGFPKAEDRKKARRLLREIDRLFHDSRNQRES